MCNTEVEQLYDVFIRRVYERYEQRYDTAYTAAVDNYKYSQLFNDLVAEIQSLRQPPYLLLYYVDWFFGFKSIKPIQSIALMFDRDPNKSEKSNRILAKFLVWYEKNCYAINGGDTCYILARQHRADLVLQQRATQSFGAHYPGSDHSYDGR